MKMIDQKEKRNYGWPFLFFFVIGNLIVAVVVPLNCSSVYDNVRHTPRKSEHNRSEINKEQDEIHLAKVSFESHNEVVNSKLANKRQAINTDRVSRGIHPNTLVRPNNSTPAIKNQQTSAIPLVDSNSSAPRDTQQKDDHGEDAEMNVSELMATILRAVDNEAKSHGVQEMTTLNAALGDVAGLLKRFQPSSCDNGQDVQCRNRNTELTREIHGLLNNQAVIQSQPPKKKFVGSSMKMNPSKKDSVVNSSSKDATIKQLSVDTAVKVLNEIKDDNLDDRISKITENEHTPSLKTEKNISHTSLTHEKRATHGSYMEDKLRKELVTSVFAPKLIDQEVLIKPDMTREQFSQLLSNLKLADGSKGRLTGLEKWLKTMAPKKMSFMHFG